MREKLVYMAYKCYHVHYSDGSPYIDWELFANRKIRDAYSEMYDLQKCDVLIPAPDKPRTQYYKEQQNQNNNDK
jgi:hypothetical protein